MVSHADRQKIAEVLREFHGIVIVLDDAMPKGAVIKTIMPNETAGSSASGRSAALGPEKWELSTATFDALISHRTLPGGQKP